MPFLDHFHKVCARKALTREEAREAMDAILEGEVSTPLIAAFLAATKVLGDGVDEVTGFAEAMRAKVSPVVPPAGAVVLDTCGTGGDGLSTFNISTAVAIVVAACGVHVAKHGNRAFSSHTGSADVLEILGVNVDLTPEQMSKCLAEAGIAFLYAPNVHPAMKHASAARRELKMRTVFNLLGPLSNPAGAQHQLIGAPNFEAARIMAQALSQLGTTKSIIAHGEDGLDEVTTTGRSMVYDVEGNSITRRAIKPEDFGVPKASIDELYAANGEQSAQDILGILDTQPSAKMDIVLVNASTALFAAGVVADFKSGVSKAFGAIASGAAKAKLEDLKRVSHEV
ncbi:MAG: anthranilate phosphoribosyltransferase [Acidobacteria bacterium]|nr:anthranilate phosphoribosyltransferase [Acidobacteriota bacterium]